MRRLSLRVLSTEDRVLLVLAVTAPVVILGGRLGWPAALTFFLSVAAVVPLAGLIGSATEALAERIGARAGGLLNATFGNAPDLLVGIFGVQRGLIPLVKATLVGALISNSALIMGVCCLVAGLLHRRPTFRRVEAGHHGVLMLLTLAAIAFPSSAAAVLCPGACHDSRSTSELLTASAAIAVVLLVAYVAYVGFGIFGLESLRGPKEEVPQETRAVARGKHGWPLWLAVGVLAGATLLLVPVIDILTGTVQATTRALGWTDVFVGIVVVANAGNVAEGYAAVKFAFTAPGRTGAEDSGLDLALGIASASSIQIATLVAPVVVLYSLTGHHMNLVFGPIELTILALLVLVFNYIAHDGESHWLEGAQLIALYAMAAIVFFVLPSSAFAS